MASVKKNSPLPALAAAEHTFIKHRNFVKSLHYFYLHAGLRNRVKHLLAT
jgi:hypothetical protein